MNSEPFAKRSLNVCFTTPAFIGNARQYGQWRTPPFKTLLRQAWRMVYCGEQAPGHDPMHATFIEEMREAEGALFGTAADKASKARQSLVRMRLNSWAEGTVETFPATQKVHHPEVQRGRNLVAADLYLGYGLLENQKSSNSTKVKNGKAVATSQSVCWQLAFPESAAGRIDAALNVIALVGTLGGRSRNGWGSIHLDSSSADNQQSLPTDRLSQQLTKDWKACMSADWAHAFGTDQAGLLIWRSAEVNDWQAAIATLATIRIAVRTQFEFEHTQSARLERRHLLAYPVTNHRVAEWKNTPRLPNALRFKVLRSDSTENKLVVQVTHLPCRPPKEFRGIDEQMLLSTWQQVHAKLDDGSLPLKRFIPSVTKD